MVRNELLGMFMTQGTSMTPQRYQADLQRPDFVADAAQAEAVVKLQALYHQLLLAPPNLNWWQRLCNQPLQPVRGLHLWGGVGRGKTYLMDMFFEALPFERKLRTHFHRFMGQVHRELAQLQAQQQQDPLLQVAQKLSDEARVICFDEFFVTDITDAMLLAGLLEACLLAVLLWWPHLTLSRPVCTAMACSGSAFYRQLPC